MHEPDPPVDPQSDSASTFYGFTRDEWARAAALSGGAPASVVAHWAENLAVVAAGGSVEVGMDSFVALGRLGTDYARRAVARLEPGLGQDIGRWRELVTGGASGLELLRRFNPRLAARVPEDDAGLIVAHLDQEFSAASRLLELAGGAP